MRRGKHTSGYKEMLEQRILVVLGEGKPLALNRVSIKTDSTPNMTKKILLKLFNEGKVKNENKRWFLAKI